MLVGEVVNAAGPVTPLGAGIVGDDVMREVDAILRRAVDIAELQRAAGEAIRDALGAEAGCVTGCSAAGITMGVAAVLAGHDRSRIERLPDTTGMKADILLPRGHDVWFGARVGQMIRLAGAHITENLTSQTAGAVYVASHHVPEKHRFPLKELVSACAPAGVPVIVDAAGSVDVRPYLEAGAGLVITSAQKNFGGLTAGIVSGTRDLVTACLLQETGIGRAMKPGKEAIAAVIAGLRHHLPRLAERQAEWRARADGACALLAGIPGIRASIELDPPENLIVRARVLVDGSVAHVSARELAVRLRAARPPIRVWEAGLAQDYFSLDPRCLSAAEMRGVCQRIRELVAGA